MDDTEENPYELAREQRIARNKAVMDKLGIPDTIAAMQQQLKASKPSKASKRAAGVSKPAQEPARRSSRQRGSPAPGLKKAAAEEEEEEGEEPAARWAPSRRSVSRRPAPLPQ
jgi:hypothetical protein